MSDEYNRSFLIYRLSKGLSKSPRISDRSDAYLSGYLYSLNRLDNALPNCSITSRLCGEACIPRYKKCRIGNTELEKIISGHEDQIRHLPKEEARIIDPDTGDLVFRKGGDEVSVYFSNDEITKVRGKIVTHNHPNLGWPKSDPRSQGLGFSYADLDFAASVGVKEIRAVGANYNYSFSSGDKRWDRNRLSKTYKKHYNQQYNQAMWMVMTGQTSAAQADFDFHHKVAESTAKELGYRYSRERVG